jgi:hypothetical protein
MDVMAWIALGLAAGLLASRPAGSRAAGKYQLGSTRRITMKIPIVVAVVVIVLFLLDMALSARIVKQYEEGVLFRLGRVRARSSLRASSRATTSASTYRRRPASGWSTR